MEEPSPKNESPLTETTRLLDAKALVKSSRFIEVFPKNTNPKTIVETILLANPKAICFNNEALDPFVCIFEDIVILVHKGVW